MAWKVEQGSKKKTCKKNALLKCIRAAVALFLLEATVFLSAASSWSGARTQRVYGIGAADVRRVFGDHGLVSQEAAHQGWSVSGPLQKSEFSRAHLKDTAQQTSDHQQPRLLVTEAPPKICNASNVSRSELHNASPQKAKKFNQVWPIISNI